LKLTTNRFVKMALFRAGNRGKGVFGQYALDMPHRARFVSVVEPDEEKRNAFATAHDIPESMRFSRPIEFFSNREKIADAVVIATLETERLNIVLDAIERGYHILVEKPLGCTPGEVIQMVEAARNFDGIFVVCHQLRHVSGYSTVKSLIDSGRFGDIITLQHSESLSYHHMAHSFVRGMFNNDYMTPMILAKSCHDMDIMLYLINNRPINVSSFGSLSYFKEENAPKDAPSHCLDDCPAYKECPYHVSKIYFNDDTDPAYLRQIGEEKDKRKLYEILRKSPYGRCVFRCDNNVVDHQVVQIEFEEGVTASFQMAGHNYFERRITKISMTNGEIYFDLTEGVVKAYTFSPLNEEIIKPEVMTGSHMGGDQVIMDSFVDAVRTGENGYVLTPVQMSLDSHLMAFAAEQSRIQGETIQLQEFERDLKCRD
jgi:predicted dehydrogenase